MREAFPSMLALLEKLISFQTVSDQPNVDLIRFVADYLDGLGVRHHIFPDDSGTKQGLIAHIGPDVDGGVVLSGHTDVVPVAGQSWQSDPWILTERDGCYFGRGTCDMKGFLALALAAIPQMLAAPMTRPIQLALSFDEEVGCTGITLLLKALAEHFPTPGAVIVGEPTMMKVVTGHKGGLGLSTKLHGRAAHSSRPDLGVSAIAHAAPLIAWHSTRQKDAHLAVSHDFIPPYSTVQVGTIKGGTAMNTVPDFCEFESDIRFLPGETAADWVAEYRDHIKAVETTMRAENDGARIEVIVTEDIPPMRPEPNGAAEQLARQITGDNSQNAVSYQTEAGHFQAAGLSTIVCGPGSIEQAHKADEFITHDQLQQGQAFMARLIQLQC